MNAKETIRNDEEEGSHYKGRNSSKESARKNLRIKHISVSKCCKAL